MVNNIKGRGCNTTPQTLNNDAKIVEISDLAKVLMYYQYKTGTSLDAALNLGILRNSITYYIRDLENLGLLGVVCKRPDSHTGHMAKHYSANPKLWRATKPQQLELSLFSEQDYEGGEV